MELIVISLSKHIAFMCEVLSLNNLTITPKAETQFQTLPGQHLLHCLLWQKQVTLLTQSVSSSTCLPLIPLRPLPQIHGTRSLAHENSPFKPLASLKFTSILKDDTSKVYMKA